MPLGAQGLNKRLHRRRSADAKTLGQFRRRPAADRLARIVLQTLSNLRPAGESEPASRGSRSSSACNSSGDCKGPVQSGPVTAQRPEPSSQAQGLQPESLSKDCTA